MFSFKNPRTVSPPSFPASAFPSIPILHRDGSAACGRRLRPCRRDSRISHQSPVTNHQSLPWSCADSPVRLELSDCELSTVDSANSFRMRSYKQTRCFARFWPKLSPCNPFRMRSYANRRCNSFRMRSYKKSGGRGFSPSRSSNFDFRVSNFARARGVPDSTLVSRILVRPRADAVNDVRRKPLQSGEQPKRFGPEKRRRQRSQWRRLSQERERKTHVLPAEQGSTLRLRV